ncbi:DUF2264 domain-containing protein [bacterium]|nr:DUF2264 domain-containing protein [bacterium]
MTARTDMNRREFLGATAGGALGFLACGRGAPGGASVPPVPADSTAAAAFAPSGLGYDYWNGVFETITRGFISNALKTSDTFAVCEYPQGTHLNNFVTARGLTCDSVTRMLPALAARIVAPQGGASLEVEGKRWELEEVFVRALGAATDPTSKDFWEYPSTKDWNQRQVESSIVAWSLWLARDKVLERFSLSQRKNIHNWLASCTVVPTRTNNWALFSAVNQAARIALSERWSEFSGDEAPMREDLAAIDSMYRGAGWYSDSSHGEAYDYYNFWVFASHSLYLDALVGERFPDIRARYRERLAQFLESTPYFFGGNGSHVLMGRSLAYRWAVLTPLTLAHGLGLWPLSTGLLRRICNRNLAFLWEAGAWDSENGKLRESLTPHSNHDICESYINHGHPYWGMQAFYAMSLGPDDPFWSAPEAPLPVEQGDFRREIAPAGLLLDGSRESGQVRLWAARCDQHYENKYYNFGWSSHFPWNVGMVGERVAPDCMLTFSGEAGAYGRRQSGFTGEVLAGGKGLRWSWSCEAGEAKLSVESLLWLEGELEWRAHRVHYAGGRGYLSAAEHTYSLGLELEEAAETQSGQVWEWARNKEGKVVFARAAFGFNEHVALGGFEGREDLNSFYPRAAQAAVSARIAPGDTVLVAALYASPKPESLESLLARSADMPPEVLAFAGLES